MAFGFGKSKKLPEDSSLEQGTKLEKQDLKEPTLSMPSSVDEFASDAAIEEAVISHQAATTNQEDKRPPIEETQEAPVADEPKIGTQTSPFPTLDAKPTKSIPFEPAPSAEPAPLAISEPVKKKPLVLDKKFETVEPTGTPSVATELPSNEQVIFPTEPKPIEETKDHSLPLASETSRQETAPLAEGLPLELNKPKKSKAIEIPPDFLKGEKATESPSPEITPAVSTPATESKNSADSGLSLSPNSASPILKDSEPSTNETQKKESEQQPIAEKAPAPKNTDPSPTKPAKKTVAELESESEGKQSVGDRLISKGLISKDQLEVAMREQRESGGKKMMGSILVEMGFITESALAAVLSESTGFEHFDVKSGALDPELVKKIPKEVAARNKIIPVSMTEDKVMVAMTDVYNIMVLDQIKRYFDKSIRIVPVYASQADIIEMIDVYYQFDMSISGILREIETGIADETITLSGEGEGYTNPTIRLVDALLIDAVKRGASDLHFEPEDTFLRLRYRIDGELRQVHTFHKNYWPAIAVRLKILSNMNIAETRRPQDGRINYNILGRVIDFRVATHPTIHGENIVMRVLDRKNSLMPLEKLGFTEYADQILRKCLKRPEGIIIITGPTGSGKTTTLYSILNYINSMTVNIMTLEDPVEYQLSLIRQTNIKAEVGMDFKSGIKSLMRQDPNIVFVGEVRDEETASLAVRAAMTGHQVYTTLHTNDAMGAIPRLIDIGVKHTLLSGSLICIMAQRLVRRLCPHCKEAHTATAEECKILGVDPASPPTIYQAKGCEKCDFIGYKGRVGVTEILPIDKELDDMIARAETRKAMMTHALSQGFITMQQEAINKVIAGMTDLPEVIKNIDMTERL